MIELSKHIGEDTDIPAGDIGVGGREISYLIGQYKRLKNRFVGTLTGKGLSYGGSLIRTEATGYGVIYFTQHMLNMRNEKLAGKSALISGAGNVAIFCAEKLIHEGAKVMTLSDSSDFIYEPDGFDHQGKKTWVIPADLAFPCATQNELALEDAKVLVDNGIQLIAEGANMPCSLDAVNYFQAKSVLFAPAKAANAGGVAVSGLEQTQNSLRLPWTREEVDSRLQHIMEHIHRQCVEYGKDGSAVDYVKGANIAGFVKVADAMLAYGIG